jgi:hypothetical protein
MFCHDRYPDLRVRPSQILPSAWDATNKAIIRPEIHSDWMTTTVIVFTTPKSSLVKLFDLGGFPPSQYLIPARGR